jgi:FKBP-type peptidyl-prolyl cis-trans isomerase FkpA
MRLYFAALLAALTPATVLAQGEPAPVDKSQDIGWHHQQMMALASRQASDGWYYLPGGVLWKRVSGDGTGQRPSIRDTVTLHYEGTFVDGEVFDSSYQRNEPATFPLQALIRAWQLAVPQMAVGDTIEIAVPSSLGYGPVGRGPIPGNATLLFRIELLAIVK